jgi:NADH dehydrogenase FAD-containing subunit
MYKRISIATITSITAVSLLHKYNNQSKSDSIYHPFTEKQKVTVLGQGWLCKGFMDHIDTKKFNITNIYQDKFIVTSQILKVINTKLGKRDKKNDNNDCEYINKTITNINVENSSIQLKDNNKLESYDFTGHILVCGLGDNTPIKTWCAKIDDINNGLNLEQHDFAVVGAGITGTELAFHLYDEMKCITLYEGLEHPYTFLPDRLRKYIRRRLYRFDIDIIHNTFYKKEYDEKYDLVVYAIGSRPNDLTKEWTQDKWLNLIKGGKVYHDIYYGGNCVWNTKLSENGDLPNYNAQIAYDQGKHIATQLNTNKTKSYRNKQFIHSLYVGNNFHALYMNNVNAYIIIPSYFIDWYHGMFY